MAKYLFQITYTETGLQEVLKEGGYKQREILETAIRSLDGWLEVMYFSFGEVDVLVVLTVEVRMRVHKAHLRVLRCEPLHDNRMHEVRLNLPRRCRVPGLKEFNHRRSAPVVDGHCVIGQGQPNAVSAGDFDQLLVELGVRRGQRVG